MAFTEHNGLLVPDGLNARVSGEQASVLIDNRTGLDDSLVRSAVETHFEEHASMLGVGGATSFGMYASEGSMLARRRFDTPGNVWDEIKLARDMAERDDDIRSTIGSMIALAFSEGMEHQHPDEEKLHIWEKMGAHARLNAAFKRLYREYLIAGQVNAVSLFTRESFEIQPEGVARTLTRQVAAPLIGVIPAEHIRVLDTDDMFGIAPLAYKPVEGSPIHEWLMEFFAASTTAARRAELRRQKPVWASMFAARVEIPWQETLIDGTHEVYRLNDRMVHRIKMPCDGAYPRPPLTANFALLEAKRLLNIMDYALLQGGANYIVVAKKGSDALPAQGPEVQNLREVVRKASRTGVIIGDHRLSIEVITPDLKELLNSDKRELLGRKLASTLLRVPPRTIDDPGAEGEKSSVEIVSRVITSDRDDLRRLVEDDIYDEARQRNRALLGRDTPSIWFPKIVLQGLAQFTDMVLKLRDRGDIPRKYAVGAAGYAYDAAVQQRKREKDRGDDDIMTPGEVPFSNPAAGPQDNNPGRPRGGSPANGAPGSQPARPTSDPARPTRIIRRTRGETVRAELDEHDEVVRVGELTAGILEEFPEHSIGRMTALERRASEATESYQEGPLIVVPVNPDHRTVDHRAVRLEEGLSMIVGMTERGAMVARALVFRDTVATIEQAENRAIAWGYEIELQPEDAPEVHAAAPPPPAEPTIIVVPAAPGGDETGWRSIVERDTDGNITGVRRERVEA